VAFVLGQLQDPATVDALVMGLEDKNQDEMVRHECAEALGAIASESAVEALKKHLTDAKQVVRESCEVSIKAK
jgi:deoxyhypusine monooxygenase